jgi:1-pyrroline-5-carboxylate dehydrogenase
MFSFTTTYVPQYVAKKKQIITDVKSMKMGSLKTLYFVTAVIHEGSFDKLASFIDQ